MAPMNMPAVLLPDDSVASATFSFTGGSAVERLRAGQMVPWAGFIVVEGVETGDGRFVSEGALSWDNDLLPVPLMAQFENPVGGTGHDGAVLAGKIMTMTRIGNKVWATGYIDPFAPGGIRLALALDRQTMRGISVDLDSVELSQDRQSGVRNISKGRIRGATVCPFQAIVEATIELTNDEGDAMAASAGSRTARVFSVVDAVESLVASGGSSIPLAPPKAWFALPSDPNEINQPLDITADGRIFGIIASEGTCHIAFADRCEPPPKSRTNYAAFRTGSVLTSEGDKVRTGPIVMDTVHPDLRRSASDAMAFYAHTGCAVADVVPYDTQFGMYVAGVMRPEATPVQIRNLRASDISPDWRFINGNPRECCALLAVNNGGFKVSQSLAASAGDYVLPGNTAVAVNRDREILALVASGGFKAALASGEDCGCAELGYSNPDDEKAVEDDEKEELALAASFMSRFGPRRFRTPKVRVFHVEQFHADHDQSTHGNHRSGGELREISDLVDEYGPDDWTMKGKDSVVSKGGNEIVAVTKMDAARAYAKDVKNERFDTSKHYDEFGELYEMVDSGGPNGYDVDAEGFRYRRKDAKAAKPKAAKAAKAAPPSGRSDYRPGRDSGGPQKEPDKYSVEDIQAEIKYLRGIEKRQGSHGLRLAEIAKLNRVALDRGGKYT